VGERGGKQVRHLRQDDAETITGTSGEDVICGGGGNDTINGGAANDIIL